MIDLILSLLDRLKDLATIRTENRRRLFEDHLEPLFNDLTSIHADYRKGFRTIHELLADASVSDQELKDKTTDLQAELLHVRQKVRAYAHALSMNDKFPAEAARLLDAVKAYFVFSSGDGTVRYPGQTGFTTLYGVLADLDGNPKFRESAVEYVSDLIDAVDRSWRYIASDYAVARVALLK